MPIMLSDEPHDGYHVCLFHLSETGNYVFKVDLGQSEVKSAVMLRLMPYQYAFPCVADRHCDFLGELDWTGW
jgi:hypothetical protein